MGDQSIVARICKGDRNAFEELVCKYEKKIYGLAYSFFNHREDAQDISQEVVIKIYKSIQSFKGDCSLGVWIHRITLNTCLDELRKRKTHAVSIDEMDIKGEQIETADPSPEKVVQQNILREKLLDAIHSLKEEYATLLILRDMQWLSYQEIADIVGASLGTVKSRINRAREALKEKIEPMRELFYS